MKTFNKRNFTFIFTICIFLFLNTSSAESQQSEKNFYPEKSLISETAFEYLQLQKIRQKEGLEAFYKNLDGAITPDSQRIMNKTFKSKFELPNLVQNDQGVHFLKFSKALDFFPIIQVVNPHKGIFAIKGRAFQIHPNADINTNMNAVMKAFEAPQGKKSIDKYIFELLYPEANAAWTDIFKKPLFWVGVVGVVVAGVAIYKAHKKANKAQKTADMALKTAKASIKASERIRRNMNSGLSSLATSTSEALNNLSNEAGVSANHNVGYNNGYSAPVDSSTNGGITIRDVAAEAQQSVEQPVTVEDVPLSH